MRIQVPRVVLSGETRTVACGLVPTIARAVRDRAAGLETLDDPAELTQGVVEVCGGLLDAMRAMKALHDTHEVLVNVACALDGGDAAELVHIVVREAVDFDARVEGLRRVAPELEMPDIDDFREEIRAGIARMEEAREASCQAVFEAARVAGWTVRRAIVASDDVGVALRAAARAGVIPEIDRSLAFGSVADRAAPQGSPARNSADALISLALADTTTQQDRRAEVERVGLELVERLSQIVAEEDA